jgi:hypothetical protein
MYANIGTKYVSNKCKLANTIKCTNVRKLTVCCSVLVVVVTVSSRPVGPSCWMHFQLRTLLTGTLMYLKPKGTAILSACHGGPQTCETSSLPRFLKNRLTDGGEVISLTRRPPFSSRKIPGTHFCYRLSRSQCGWKD